VNAIPVFTEKVFGFVTGTAFTLRAESRSPTPPEYRSAYFRNRVRMRPDSSLRLREALQEPRGGITAARQKDFSSLILTKMEQCQL
jgi:hypothetical protein